MIQGALVWVLATGCGGGAQGDSAVRGVVLVSAASSLSAAFADVETAFEARHPGVDLLLNLAGSSTLREQILGGAPVDVFASADPSNMDRVVTAGAAVGQPRTFARNQLQIAVPAGNPARVTGLADLANPRLFVGLCAVGVPCGNLAQQALVRAGVVPSVDTYEPDVRALLTKIEAGELDAGIVYVTDVAAGRVDGIVIPAVHNVIAEYPIVVLAQAPNPTGATAFVTFVLSPEGQALLRRHGFAAPNG